MPRPRSRQDSGFALLLVFLMAAVIAITLYSEIPRVAFEAQRQKEQLLVARGEQYKRAVQVFVVKNKRYPTSIEELENFNNQRFLRKRYVDPMTGKDEWRIIHIQNGILTDSKVVQPQTAANAKQTASTAGQYVAEQPQLGQTISTGAATGVNIAQRRRASDDRSPGLDDTASAMNDPNAQQNPGGTTTVGQLPPNLSVPGLPGMPGQSINGVRSPVPVPVPGAITNPSANQGYSYVGSSTYVGGGSTIGSQPNAPGVAGQYPGAAVNSQTGGVAPGYGTTPGSIGTPTAYGQPGLQTQPSNQAITMINNMLTTPRPVTSASGSTTASGSVIGAGIAGFASTADQEGIMLYGDRSNYSEWEFYFDQTKYRSPRNPVTGATVGTPAGQLGNTQGMGGGMGGGGFGGGSGSGGGGGVGTIPQGPTQTMPTVDALPPGAYIRK
jgi:uncharacterized membrane protein YgcG